jgi:hypothetical protein
MLLLYTEPGCRGLVELVPTSHSGKRIHGGGPVCQAISERVEKTDGFSPPTGIAPLLGIRSRQGFSQLFPLFFVLPENGCPSCLRISLTEEAEVFGANPMHRLGIPLLPWRPFETDVLGLEPDESDPVRIILAAQLRLRSHRRQKPARPLGREANVEVRKIVGARDSLLRRVITDLSSSTIRTPSRGLEVGSA